MRLLPTIPVRKAGLFVAGLLLLPTSHASDRAEDQASAPGAYPALQLPGQCAPMLQPPERVVETWRAMDRGEHVQEPAEELVTVEADRMELTRDGASLLEGDVWLQQGERFLEADALAYDESTGLVRSLAPATFGTRQLIVDAESATYNTQDGLGVFENTEYFLLQRQARGTASALARTGESTAQLDDVKYTSCPSDDEDWWLKASSLDIDQDKGVGVARNVRVAFMGVPFFYVPWMSFPTNEERKTGFLFPEFGDSGRQGAWLRVPYYFNLAPNYDATLTPYFMSKRGTMLEGEFRYLFGWGAGELSAEYLDRDRYDGGDDGDLPPEGARYYYQLRHGTALPADWKFRISYQAVSDEEYFQDFGESGLGALRSNLAQSASLSRTSLEHGLSLSVLRYQTVDPTVPEARRPYEKWPELDYYYAPLALQDWLWVEVDGESVNFQRDNRISGWRHNLQTSLSTDLGDPGLRATPRLSWWHTRYDLEDLAEQNVSLERSLPVASLDTVARFSRPLASGGRQTLEPRFFYVYVPYRDQDAIPRFDTRPTSDAMATLFQENRFSGPDRIGDQNRATIGLGSGLIDAAGREWFNVAVARAWYFDDRAVTLDPAAEPATETASDYHARAEYRPNEKHTGRLELSWDPYEDEYGYGSAQYQYKPGDLTVFNLAYRYREPATKQADASFVTPISRRWSIFGRAIYSFEEERSQETLAGFQYETCCWVFRTFSRRFFINLEGEMDQSLWFQLELKGLSSVGRRIDEFLTDNIYGYGDTP